MSTFFSSVASFAFQLVRSRAVAAGDPLPQLLTAPDQDAVIADLLEGDEADAEEGSSRWPESLGTAVRRSRAFRSELRALFALATELGLSPDDLERLGADRANAVWSAAGTFWREYRYVLSRLRPAHRDPAEVLREATDAL
ncbi:MAG: ATP-dependent helicase, partial [Micrococcales bacterium]|nr:ATP-dependent helicase [Micrococcales bacterium]